MDGTLDVRVLRKSTTRIFPFIMLLYFVALVDRVRIEFAALTLAPSRSHRKQRVAEVTQQ
jgi:ACS family tartrate transporter-like MFS transporter